MSRGVRTAWGASQGGDYVKNRKIAYMLLAKHAMLMYITFIDIKVNYKAPPFAPVPLPLGDPFPPPKASLMLRVDENQRKNTAARPRLGSYAAVMKYIKAEIRHGRLVPGQRLDLRETLTRELGTSSLTVQRAFNRLSAEGFIVSRGRAGTFVAARPPNLFRTGFLFDLPHMENFANKHRQILAGLSANFEGTEQEIVPYYGVVSPDIHRNDRGRLIEDLAAERLSGLLWAYPGAVLYPEDTLWRDYGVPSVFLASSMPPGDYGMVTLEGRAECAVREVARMGGRRVAVLVMSGATHLMDEFLRALQAADLETHPAWIHGVDAQNPHWAAHDVRAMFSLPREMQPDSLIVSDDNLVSSAVEGLLRSGEAERVKLVLHSNFPELSTAALPSVRVGFDVRKELQIGMNLLADMCAAIRRGDPMPYRTATLMAEVDYEVKP